MDVNIYSIFKEADELRYDVSYGDMFFIKLNNYVTNGMLACEALDE